jgi:hypothetical protein
MDPIGIVKLPRDPMSVHFLCTISYLAGVMLQDGFSVEAG